MDSVRASIGPALADRYSIERELGSGAMALVFLANDLKHDRWVAIKVLKPSVASAIGAERFHREIEVVARLAHPHILPLHDSGEAAGLLYFVMPHVEGESLRERLYRDQCVPVSEATRIAREMADALESAHRHGVVHRDVKPANIMLSAGHAQLADFGIAYLLEGAEATLTGTGITVGTPAYMSPEQVSGDESLDGRSDIYSLGCVLYEMLTGRPPFVDGSRRAVLIHHMVDAPPDIRSQCPDAPLELAGILRTALEKDPSKRFASADEMSQALASVRSSIDVTAGARIRRALKRRGRKLKSWQRVGIAALALLLAIGATAILKEIFWPAPEALARADPRGSYMVLPFSRGGQTQAEASIAAEAADLLASSIDRWDEVEATREYELRGPMFDLGIKGPTLSRLEDGLLLAQTVRRGTLVALWIRVVNDTVHLEAHKYDTASGERLGGLQTTQAPLGDLPALVAPVAAVILELRGVDPAAAVGESTSQEVWQQFHAAETALYDWRLREAERGFRRTIALDPDFARAHHYLAVTLFWETSRDVERRRVLIPQIQRISGDAARLASEAELNPGLEANIRGLHAFSIGDYETAREEFHELIARDSSDTEAWLFLGAVESADPWQAKGTDPPMPRGNINLARYAFDFASQRWPEFQISRGLHFEISQKLGDHQISPSCPMFISSAGSDLVPPYTDPPDAEWFAVFPTLQGDTIAWSDCDSVFEGMDRADARVMHRQAAEHLYEASISEIERWARYAPDHARPREEWADMVMWWHSRQACDTDTAMTAGLIREALGHLESALSLSSDTTPQQHITRAVLRMAAGMADAAQTARVVDGVVEGMQESTNGQYKAPSWTAANSYLAAGQPTKAIERMRGIWVDETRSAVDPTDEEQVDYEFGDVFQAMGEIRVLGALGATGAGLSAAAAFVNAEWTDPSRSDRARAVLRRSSARERARSADIRPALALDQEMGALWFSEWGDLEDRRARIWNGLLAGDAQADSLVTWLTEAVDHLETMNRPFVTEYFLAGLLAQRVGDDERAADLLGSVETCPLNVKSLDVGWGLSRLSRLYRARSLERLGRQAEAVAEYAQVAAEWADAESDLADVVEEATSAVERAGTESIE